MNYFSLLAFITCVATCRAQVTNITNITNPLELREELLARAQYVTTFLAGEIKLLKLEFRFFEADGLERELVSLIELRHALRSTEVGNVTAAEVKQLDDRLTTLEIRIDQELDKLGRGFVNRFELQALIGATEGLLLRVSDTVKRLVKANRSIESRGLEAEERRLLEISILLRATQDSEEIRRLEEALIQIEAIVNALLNDIDLSGLGRRKRELEKRHHKPLVLKSIQDLLAIADRAVKTLISQNKTQATAFINATENALRQLAVRLNATENETIVIEIQEQAAILSYQLEQQLSFLGFPLTAQELRDQLVTSVGFLYDKAEQTVANLKSQNRTHDLSTLYKSLEAFQALVKELQNATQVDELRRLETRIQQEEFVLNAELQRLAQPVVSFNEIFTLLNKAEELSVKIFVEVRRLRAEGKSLLAEGLLEEERELATIEALLLTAVFPQDIARVEVRLKGAETRIDAELAKIKSS